MLSVARRTGFRTKTPEPNEPSRFGFALLNCKDSIAILAVVRTEPPEPDRTGSRFGSVRKMESSCNTDYAYVIPCHGTPQGNPD
uniref:Uncharacterized protein n=1 Tax=Panagrellus redivivus TaxID=6233 RepID=A0A7E4VX60_PANRE